MKNLALYMRISQEDDKDTESESIQNQRDLLHNFIASKAEFANYNIVEIIDDGKTGTTLNRKGLQELLQRAGKDIFLILVKDFSRFARNLIEVGNYLDSVFPFLGVRFISVNDGYDSAESVGKTIGLDMSLKAMVYDMYSKDLSKKIASSKELQMKSGKYIGRVSPFGYKKDPNDYNKIIIDEEAAKIVKQIFELSASGKKTGEVAKILNAENVPTPSIYRREILKSEIVKSTSKAKITRWSAVQVLRIITDERYIGTYISRKEIRENLSSKRKTLLPKEEWIRIENVQEPIVSRDIFERASQTLNKKKYGRTHNKGGVKSLFATVLKCQFCGRNLSKTVHKESGYACLSKRNNSNIDCKDIFLLERDLETAILYALNIQIELFESNKSALNSKKQKENLEKSIKEREKELKTSSKKSIYLFEQFADEKITIDDYKAKKNANDKAISELKENLQILQTKLQMIMTQNENSNSLSKYKFVDKLTRDMVLELVREIKVFEDNRIEIVWNFKEN